MRHFLLLLFMALCLNINSQDTKTTNARVVVSEYPTEINGIRSPYITIDAYKFKSRKGVVERMLNDFDRTSVAGYRLNLTMTITNKDKNTRSFSASCIALVDEEGIEYEVANETEEVRRDVLVGNISCKPNISRRVIISYVVPNKNKQYKVVFKKFD